jgi:hypothetical protein
MGESFPSPEGPPERGARRRWPAAAATAVAMAASSAAGAAELRDAASGFRMPLDVPGARTCIVIPERAADPFCAALQLGVLEQFFTAEARPFGAGAIVREGKLVYVTAASTEGTMDTAEAIEAYVGATEVAMRRLGKVQVRGVEPSVRYDIIRNDRRHAVRYVVDLELAGPQPVPMRFINYAFPGERHIVSVSFFAVGADVSELGPADALAVAATLPQRTVVGFGEPRRNQTARAFGALVGSLLPFAAAAGIAVAIIVWRRRRARGAK